MSNTKKRNNDVEAINSEFVDKKTKKHKPLVSLITPAFNEESIIRTNIETLCNYMENLEYEYNWELIIINDGSTDKTGDIAEELAAKRNNVRVYHHVTNFGLGQAFKFAFNKCKGDFIITMDIDLSYGPEHIENLLNRIRKTKAKLVLASPYMSDGTIKNVPFTRKYLSILANKFLSIFAHGHLSTLTCMVRAYDGPFIRALNLRSLGMEVMPETIYKSMILRARIEQIPANLDWDLQNIEGKSRTSSMKVFRHIFSTLLSGFIFRPFMFFILPGLLFLLFSIHTNFWAFMHFFEAYAVVVKGTEPDKISAALSLSYDKYPYTYIVGLLSLMLSIQLIGLGVQALQAKNYFEELFHLGSRLTRLEQDKIE